MYGFVGELSVSVSVSPDDIAQRGCHDNLFSCFLQRRSWGDRGCFQLMQPVSTVYGVRIPAVLVYF